jgi:hypothetical protein
MDGTNISNLFLTKTLFQVKGGRDRCAHGGIEESKQLVFWTLGRLTLIDTYGRFGSVLGAK